MFRNNKIRKRKKEKGLGIMNYKEYDYEEGKGSEEKVMMKKKATTTNRMMVMNTVTNKQKTMKMMKKRRITKIK